MILQLYMINEEIDKLFIIVAINISDMIGKIKSCECFLKSKLQ